MLAGDHYGDKKSLTGRAKTGAFANLNMEVRVLDTEKVTCRQRHQELRTSTLLISVGGALKEERTAHGWGTWRRKEGRLVKNRCQTPGRDGHAAGKLLLDEKAEP